MTTFNLKNQNRKFVFLRYVSYALAIIAIISIIYLFLNPGYLDKVNLGSIDDKNVIVLTDIKPNQEKLIVNDKSTINAIHPKTSHSQELSDSLNSVIVSTNSGKIRGKIHEVLGVKVNTFLGIPYGKAPTGVLRFRRTQPVKPWTNILNATRLPAACIQSEYTQKLFPVKILNYELSEDCLYMNIWTPVTNESSLPVMVWIHGGMFTIGSVGVDEYDGSVLASFGNVIVVSIQYRLGLFGFLDLETDEIPGNMGLSDQAMAIKWIYDNIDNFGGDSKSITLMGQSAGGISIGLHMMTDTKKYFKRVILESGSSMLLNQVYGRGHKVAEEFVRKIGCLPEGTDIYDAPELIVKCIDTVSLKKISQAQQEMVTNNPVPFLPTIPSDFVENFPTESNENITYNQKDFLIGFNQDEGTLILHLAYPKNYTRTTVPIINTLDEARNAIVMMAVDGGFPEMQAKSMAAVLLNGNETDTPENWARKIASVFGDIMFICPTLSFADKFSALNSTVYMYIFTHRAHNSVWGKWMGVTHHDELNYVFGVPLRYPNMFDGQDINFSKRLIKTWTQFAKTGSVSPIDYQHDWHSYDSSKPYMELNARNAYIGHRYHEETCNLYNALIEYLNR
ncbi:acetylcholinesterase-like [Oppia nitens]|uniref:acetylcholinesterase-like n=1 Tax=Oppia nitens TaxID=1686743 RepID=UPI0023DB6DE5|nr:acetylcholinesterase-like [Oppia nitens]